MKTNTVFKRAHNQSLSRLSAYAIGSDIGSEPHWAQALAVSRTTVRAVMAALAAKGVLAQEGRRKVLLRRPTPADLYPDLETEQVGAIVEKRFMKWILDGDCKPGQQINGLDLARQFGVSTSAIRDYLNRFSQFGLLRAAPQRKLGVQGIHQRIRRGIVRGAGNVRIALGAAVRRACGRRPGLGALERIKQEHLDLLREAESRFADFSELDERFHRLINDASRNRFIVSFYDIISMIFHYHYQWNKRDEKQRNVAAMREHLIYIDGLQSGDRVRATESCRAHMATARATLMSSIGELGRKS